MGKNLQERIKDIENYRPNITFQDGAIIIKIQFKKGWQILQPENSELVAFSKDDNINGLYWYVALLEHSDFIFDSIEQTIAVNQEMEKKIELYETKIQELKDLFLSDVSFEKLQTLQFVFNNPNKPKRAYNKSKKIQEEVILNNLDNNTISINPEPCPITDNIKWQEPCPVNEIETVLLEDKLTITQEDINIDEDIDNLINKAIEEQTK